MSTVDFFRSFDAVKLCIYYDTNRLLVDVAVLVGS